MPGSWDKNGTCFWSYFPYHDNEAVELGENRSIFGTVVPGHFDLGYYFFALN